jgi:hypothetical protein
MNKGTVLTAGYVQANEGRQLIPALQIMAPDAWRVPSPSPRAIMRW